MAGRSNIAHKISLVIFDHYLAPGSNLSFRYFSNSHKVFIMTKQNCQASQFSGRSRLNPISFPIQHYSQSVMGWYSSSESFTPQGRYCRTSSRIWSRTSSVADTIQGYQHLTHVVYQETYPSPTSDLAHPVC